MKRISRFALMAMLSVLLLGGTRALAGDNGNGNDQGQGNKGDKSQGNKGGNNQDNNGGSLVQWIDNLLNDIFGGNNQGSNNSQGNNSSGYTSDSGWANGGGTTSGGGTAPIDGGIGLLLAAGIGMGIRKLARRS